MNVARRLDEREYTQYSSPQRQRNLRVLENTNERRNFNDSRTTVTVRHQKSSKVFISQLVVTFTLLFLFVSCIGFLALQAQITSVERDISRLNGEIYELSTQNNMMQSVITTATNIETIRENASMLGMGKPSYDNVEYISANDASTITLSSANSGN